MKFKYLIIEALYIEEYIYIVFKLIKEEKSF
jgi:hypothetical protein